MQGEGGSTSVRWVSSLLIMQSVMKGHKEAQIRGKKSTFMPLVFFFFFFVQNVSASFQSYLYSKGISSEAPKVSFFL